MIFAGLFNLFPYDFYPCSEYILSLGMEGPWWETEIIGTFLTWPNPHWSASFLISSPSLIWVLLKLSLFYHVHWQILSGQFLSWWQIEQLWHLSLFSSSNSWHSPKKIVWHDFQIYWPWGASDSPCLGDMFRCCLISIFKWCLRSGDENLGYVHQ